MCIGLMTGVMCTAIVNVFIINTVDVVRVTQSLNLVYLDDI